MKLADQWLHLFTGLDTQQLPLGEAPSTGPADRRRMLRHNAIEA
ncbi:MAG: hypothetical protein AB8B70_10490 [Prochlorococcus sp.]